jgi:hypothetical protein
MKIKKENLALEDKYDTEGDKPQINRFLDTLVSLQVQTDSPLSFTRAQSRLSPHCPYFSSSSSLYTQL